MDIEGKHMDRGRSAQQLTDSMDELLAAIEQGIGQLQCESQSASNDRETVLSELQELKRCVRDYERLCSELEHERIDYRREYSRYRFEYDMLVGSGSVRALFGLKRLLGRGYTPLFPSNLPIDEDDPYVKHAKRVEEKDLGTASSAQFFSKNWASLIEPIRDSTGSEYYTKIARKAGIITDEYMYNYYKDAMTFEYIAADSYKEQIDNGELSFILFVSCWNGMQDGDYRSESGRERVVEVFEYAKRAGIPTVFQTIEDPTNYLKFLDIAKHADFIFTSDANMVDLYKQDTGNDNVHVMMYGINPLFHNPIGFMRAKANGNDRLAGSTLFAGSWYWRYPKRCEDCSRIFDGVIEGSDGSLVIIDRNSNLPAARRAPHVFPDIYHPYVVSAIGHDELQKVHRLFDYSVCLNTIKNSETMCAMRVYELQALGSLMLSNYALSVSTRFPSIFMISNEDEVAHILKGYTKREIFNMQVEGIRRMYSGCTVFDRLNEMFSKTGMGVSFEERRIVVVCAKDDIPSVLADKLESADNVEVLAQEDVVMEELSSSYDYAIWPSEKLLEYEFFLEDAINAFKFVDVDCVAYVDDCAYEDSYDYVQGVGKQQDVLFSLARTEADRLDDHDYLSQLSAFSIARAKWGRSTASIAKKLGVIVPIYNNGFYLKNRCFLSLLRSSVFDEMMIYLVDDGSSDPYTTQVIEELCANYDNVVAHRCAESGSGSASRPRNEGLRLCKETYVTYLDPDNEAIGDGYAKLLRELEDSEADFSIGGIIRIAEPAYEPVKVAPSFEVGLNLNPLGSLIDSHFMPRSIQASVIRRDFLIANQIENVVGAIGQDSLFYMEMMMNAHAFTYVDTPVHIYYAERGGSAVNTISRRFFEKSLLLEERQVEVLKEHGLLDDYKQLRLEHFLDNWYLKKLTLVSGDERALCEEIIERIKALYR